MITMTKRFLELCQLNRVKLIEQIQSYFHNIYKENINDII